MMTFFYRFMVFISDIELSIAQSTGRNPDNVRALKQQLAYWQSEQDRYEISQLGA